MNLQVLILSIEGLLVAVEAVVIILLVLHIRTLSKHTDKLDRHIVNLSKHTDKMDDHLLRIDKHVVELDDNSERMERNLEKMVVFAEEKLKK